MRFVELAQLDGCTRGFEAGRSGWVAERLESWMLFVVVSVLEKVHTVVFRVRRCLGKRK